MEGIKIIKRTIGKNSKVTLLDRLKNTSKNIYSNPFTFLCPIVAGTLLSATTYLGIKAHNAAKINEGYSNAYSQVSNIVEILNSDTNFWKNIPLNQVVFEPVKNSIDLSLSKKDSQEGQEIKGLVKKVEEVMYSNNNGRTNNLTRKVLIEQLSEKLGPLSRAYEKYMTGVSLSGLLTILAGLISFGVYSEAYFEDHNSQKKTLNKRYKHFLKSIKKSIKDKKLDEEGVNYLGRFFEKMNIPNSDYFGKSLLLLTLEKNLEPESKPILKAISENPCYNHSTLEDICVNYYILREQDINNPLVESKLKSRKDLFLDIWLKNGNRDPLDMGSVSDTILQSLSYEKEIPELLDALISGTKRISEIKEAKDFLDSGIIYEKDTARKLVQHYLQTPESPPLAHNLPIFRHYANKKIETLNPTEALSLLSELEKLKDITMRHQNYRYSSYWPEDSGFEEVIDIARETLKQNPLLVSKVLDDAPMIARQRPTIRNIYKNIFARGLVPTTYLITRLHETKNPDSELKRWENTRKDIKQGKFDPSDELKKNLEYTTFYLEATKFGKGSDFESYEAIFGDRQNG